MSACCLNQVVPGTVIQNTTSLTYSYPNKLCFHFMMINITPKLELMAFSIANLSLFMKDS